MQEKSTADNQILAFQDKQEDASVNKLSHQFEISGVTNGNKNGEVEMVPLDHTSDSKFHSN